MCIVKLLVIPVHFVIITKSMTTCESEITQNVYELTLLNI